MITQSELMDIIHYDWITGIFTWKTRRSQRTPAGSIAGTKHHSQYINIKIKEKGYRAHRLAHLYMRGCFPDEEIDHKNHVRYDNRWLNLRPVTKSDNAKNQSIKTNNKSGITGVHWKKSNNKWEARIYANGKRINLGLFADLDEAAKARKDAEVLYGYHANHGK